MTIVQHLDELRTRLLRSIWALLIAVTAAMFFYKELIEIVTLPHVRAMGWLGQPARFIISEIAGSVGAVMKIVCIVGLVLTLFATAVILAVVRGTKVTG